MNKDKVNDYLRLIDDQRLELSDDIHTQTGCVIITDKEENDGLIYEVVGVNKMPDGVFVLPERQERSEKPNWIAHAEMDALTECARAGHATMNATIILNWFPCVDCARNLAMAGIKKVVCYEPEWDNPKYNFKDAISILVEAEQNIEIQWIK